MTRRFETVGKSSKICNFELNETCGKQARQPRQSFLPKFFAYKFVTSRLISRFTERIEVTTSLHILYALFKSNEASLYAAQLLCFSESIDHAPETLLKYNRTTPKCKVTNFSEVVLLKT